MTSKTRPPTFPPKRSRSISASSASPAPLSPAYRLAEQLLSITDGMTNFSIDREQRLSNVKRASTEAERLAHQLLVLRDEVSSKPNDLSLRMKLLEIEAEWKRAFEREKVAKQALNSPSIAGAPLFPPFRHPPPLIFPSRCGGAGPSTPRPALLDDSSSPDSAFPPSPPRTPSPALTFRRLSLSSCPPKPSFAHPPSSHLPHILHRSPSPRPLSYHAGVSHSRSPSHSTISGSPRPSSPGRGVLLPLPPQTPVPRSDPLPALDAPSRSVVVTSHLDIPHHAIVQELGLVQATAPSSADLSALKERLRVEGEKRGAHAVVGVATKMWEGQGELVGVGRAVKLKRV